MINLKKGQSSNIDDLKFEIGLGWTPNPAKDYDLDLSVFMLNENKFLPSDKHFIFYGNPESPDKSIIHSGDDRTGGKNDGGDDETLKVDLSLIDKEIKEIILVVSIYDATILNQNFGEVNDSYVRILSSDGNEIVRYDLNEDFSIEKSIIFGKLLFINKKWEFYAIGQGFDKELEYHVTQYYTGLVTK